MSDILKAIGFTSLGIVGVIAFIAFIFIISTAFSAFFVALIWNWIGLHSLFGLGTLSFWEVVGVAAAFNFLSGVFGGTTVTTTGS